MIRICRIVSVTGTDPYRNQAVEELLLKDVREDELILYLWQNDRTVVIGRNQDAACECNMDALLSDGGRAARRLSGGGAVYHDLGNLNFTFISARENHDTARQTRIILDAVSSLGIEAQCSGRNDLIIGGKKFSGCAYYDNGHAKLHHGTILVDRDPESMRRYLTPSRRKLSSKGVASVESRVGCLKELDSQLTVRRVREALIDALRRDVKPYKETYCGDNTLPFTPEQIEDVRSRFADRGWILSGKNHSGQTQFSQAQSSRSQTSQTGRIRVIEVRNSAGLFTVHVLVRDGVIADTEVFTDALDTEAAVMLKKELIGRRYGEKEIEQFIASFGETLV